MAGLARTIQLLTTLISSIERVMQSLSVPARATLRICSACLKLSDVVEKYRPLDWVLEVRDVRFDGNGLDTSLERALTESDCLAKRRDALDRDFDLTLARNAENLRVAAGTLRGAGLWERCFGSEYRTAKKLYRRLRRARPPRDRYQMADDLTRLAGFFEDESAFAENEEYQEVFGRWWRGMATDFGALKRVVAFHSSLRQALPPDHTTTDGMRKAVLQVPADSLRQCDQRLTACGAALRSFKQVQDDRPLSDVVATYQTRSEGLGALLSAITPARALPHITVGVLLNEGVSKGRRGIELKRQIGSNEIGRRECGEPADVHAAEVEATVRVSQTLRKSDLAPELQSWLRHAQYISRRNLLEKLLVSLVKELDRYISCRVAAIEKGGLDIKIWFVESADLQTTLRTTRERINGALGKGDELRPWTLYVASWNETLRLGLTLCVEEYEWGRVKPESIPALFRFLYHNSVARAAIRKSPTLRQFERATHDEVRRRFASLDKEIIEARRRKLAADIRTAYRPVAGVGNGPIGDWTEWPLLYHQMQLDRPRLATRKLMERAERAVQVLKPCFLMSPLSVAQYLPLGGPSFDIVVMDEASQLRFEDALGAVVRGSQLIVVGDSKQLPPTTFFQKVAVDGDEPEELTAPEDVESILAAAKSAFQTRHLRWHYRSKHHSLIAFSNFHFYDGSLTVFPSAFENHPEFGVREHFVGGTFNDRTNHQEAKAIVEAVIDHAKHRGHESLGVATMNFEQREYIEELLEERLRNDPFGRTFAERMQNHKEPLFIKNLENVQGDERDVILISMTYGPREPGGKVPQRFGPINTKLGWRRLNVLFTRARIRVVVFRSLEPEDIKLEPGQESGLPAFRGYIAYAKGERLRQFPTPDGRESNEFERCVAREVEKFNVTVVPQVGVAGYFIDLAVEHPNDPGRYILGIECDGATYHSARSTRERDRLREAILTQSHGWAIHRIWSTEWFHNRKREIERLRERIERELRNAERTLQRPGIPPLDQRLRQAREKFAALRDRLRQQHPNVPPEREVLRDDHVKQLLDKKPVTLEDWLNRIDRAIRESLDSAQWRTARDEILEILQELKD
jgi:very-short-patch-repair endonuclease